MNSGAKKITMELLSDDLKAIIQASFIVFPVTYDYVFNNTNPCNYEYVRVTNGEHLNEIFLWNNGFHFIGGYPTQHTHTQAQIIDFAHNHDDRYETKDEINYKLSFKADKDLVIGEHQPTNNNMWYKELIE